MRTKRPSQHVTYDVGTKRSQQTQSTQMCPPLIADIPVRRYLLGVTLVTDIVGMSTDKQFVNTLEDNIRYRGAMDKLISDLAQLEISNRAKDLLRAIAIDDWQSEPGYQHQNFAERRYNTLKTTSNTVMNRYGAPDYTWLLSLMYVCYLLNHTATKSLGWRTPLEKLDGQTPDISAILNYHFWEPVYYMIEHGSFPSETTE
jgi:hypothetical protein